MRRAAIVAISGALVCLITMAMWAAYVLGQRRAVPQSSVVDNRMYGSSDPLHSEAFFGTWENNAQRQPARSRQTPWFVNGECSQIELVCSVAETSVNGRQIISQPSTYKVQTWNDQEVIASQKHPCSNEVLFINRKTRAVNLTISQNSAMLGLGALCGDIVDPPYRVRLLAPVTDKAAGDCFWLDAQGTKHPTPCRP